MEGLAVKITAMFLPSVSDSSHFKANVFEVSFEVGESIEFRANGSETWQPGFLENTQPLQVVAENEPGDPIPVTSEQIRAPRKEGAKSRQQSATRSKSSKHKSKPVRKKNIKEMDAQELRLLIEDYQAKEKNQNRYISVMQNKQDALQLKYDDAEGDVDRLRKKLKSAQVDLRDAKDDLRRAEDKLEKRDKELDSIEREHEASTREIVDTSIELDDTKKRIKIQDDVIKQLSAKIGELNNEVETLRSQGKVDGYGPGAYTFVDGTIVREDFSLESSLVRQVEPGETVLVQQCARHSFSGRHLLRAEIQGGWVTLADLTSGLVFASPVNQDYWRQQLQEKMSANQILKMRNEELADQLRQQTQSIQEFNAVQESLQNLEIKYNSLQTSYEDKVQEHLMLKDKLAQKSRAHLTKDENDTILKLSKELEDVNSVNTDLRNEIDVYRQDSDVHATIRNQRDLAREALKQRNEQYMNLEADYEKKCKEYSSLRERATRLQEEHDDVHDSLQLAKQAEENHKQVIASYAAQLAQVEDIRQKGHAVEATELKLKKKDRKIDQLTRKLNKMERDVDKVKSYDRKLKAVKQDYQKSQKDLANANQSMVKLRKETIAVREKKEKYEAAARKLKDKWEHEKMSNETLRIELSGIKLHVKKMEQDCKKAAKLELELMAKKSELYELLNVTPEKRFSDLQVIVKMKDAEIKNLKKTNQSLQAKNQILDAELEETSNELKEKQKKLNSTRIEVERLSQREAELTERFARLKAALKEIKNAFESMQDDFVDAKEKLQLIEAMKSHPIICTLPGLSILEENQELKISQTENSLLRQEIQRLKMGKPQKEISSTEVETLRGKLLTTIRDLQTTKASKTQLELKIKELGKQLEKHRDQAGIHELQYQNKSLHADNVRLQKVVDDQLITIQSYETDIRDLNKELKKRSREASEARSETSDTEKLLEKERNLCKQLNEKLKQIETQRMVAESQVKRAAQGKASSERQLQETSEKFRREAREREEKHRKDVRDLRERYEKQMKQREEKYIREKQQLGAKRSFNQLAGTQVHMVRSNLEKTTRSLKAKEQECQQLKALNAKLNSEANTARNSLVSKQASVNGLKLQLQELKLKLQELKQKLKNSVGENLESALSARDRALEDTKRHKLLLEKSNKEKDSIQKRASDLTEQVMKDREAVEMATKLLVVAQETENAQAEEIILLQNHIEDLTKSLVIARKTSEKAEQIEEKGEALMQELREKREKVRSLEKQVRELESECNSISGHFELHSRELTAVKRKLQEREEAIVKKDAIILKQMKESQEFRSKSRECAQLQGKCLSLENLNTALTNTLEEKTTLAYQKQKAMKNQLMMIKAKENELTYLRQVQEQLIKEKGTLSSDVMTLQAQLELSQRELTKRKEDSEAEKDLENSRRQKIEKLTKEVETLKQNLTNTKQVNVSISEIPETRVDIPAKSAAKLAFYVVELQTKVGNLKEELRVQEQRLTDVMVANEKASRQARISSDAARSSNQELEAIKAYIKVVGQENESLKHQMDAARVQMDSLKEEKRQLNEEIDTLRLRITEIDEHELSTQDEDKKASSQKEEMSRLTNELEEKDIEIKKLSNELAYLHRYSAEAFQENEHVHKAHRETFKCLEHLRARSKIVFQQLIQRIQENPTKCILEDYQREVRNFFSEHYLENINAQEIGLDFYQNEGESEEVKSEEIVNSSP